MTAKCSACHSTFFFFWFSRQDHERCKSHQVPREHFSQLCKHAFVLFFLTVFLMTQYVSVIKGGTEGDSRGERRDVRLHPRTRTHTQIHTEAYTVCCLLKHLCFWKKTKQLSFFIRQPWGDTSLFFLPGEFQWVSQKGWASPSAIWEAIRSWDGHHSTVKGILLMWHPFDQLTSAEWWAPLCQIQHSH